MKKIKIMVEGITLEAELLNTPTAKRIWENLPFNGSANVWGEEIYFRIPVNLNLEADAGEEMAVGDVAYWPKGPAFCIFFGPTPVSIDDTPRAYSPVNVFGKIKGDPTALKSVSHGSEVEVTASK